MKKSILITRPINQAQEIKHYLEKENFTTFIEPIFTVETCDINIAKIDHVSGLIITSQNAAKAVFKAINQFNLPKNIPLFSVGKKTAQLFVKEGFSNVTYSTLNSVFDLKEIILQNVTKNDVLLYFCGEFISLDLQEEFAKYDIKLEKILSYKIHPLQNFSQNFLKQIHHQPFDFILLYSKNSSKTFLQLVKKHNISELIHHTKILCLSDNILDLVQEYGFKNSSTFAHINILQKFYE